MVALKDLDLLGEGRSVGFFFLRLFVDADNKVSLDSLTFEDFNLFAPKSSSVLCRFYFNVTSFSISSSSSTFSTSDLPSCLVLRRFNFILFLWTTIMP